MFQYRNRKLKKENTNVKRCVLYREMKVISYSGEMMVSKCRRIAFLRKRLRNMNKPTIAAHKVEWT